MWRYESVSVRDSCLGRGVAPDTWGEGCAALHGSCVGPLAYDSYAALPEHTVLHYSPLAFEHWALTDFIDL